MPRLLLNAGAILLLAVAGCAAYPKPNPSDAETARQIFEIRQGTDRYLDVARAKADGYFRGTGYSPRQGYQFFNPKFLSFFDLKRPPILLYDERKGRWQLLGVMFAAPIEADPTRVFPFEGAEFLAHEPMCHYLDGTILLAKSPEECPKVQGLTKAELGFWHPNIWLVAVWAWSPNPNGLFSLFNPLLDAGR